MPPTTLMRETMQRDTPAGKRAIVVLTPDGANRLIWDPKLEAERAEAKAIFDRAMTTGMTAYAMTADEGEIVRKFPEEAEKVVISAPLVGG